MGEGKTHIRYPVDQAALQVMGNRAQIHTPEKTRESLHLPPLPSKEEYLSSWMDDWACSLLFSALCKVQSQIQMVFSSKTKYRKC